MLLLAVLSMLIALHPLTCVSQSRFWLFGCAAVIDEPLASAAETQRLLVITVDLISVANPERQWPVRSLCCNQKNTDLFACGFLPYRFSITGPKASL